MVLPGVRTQTTGREEAWGEAKPLEIARPVMSANPFKVRKVSTLWILVCAWLVASARPPAAFAHADRLALIDILTRQIESDPKNAGLYLKRGELYRIHADWALAETDYDRVAQLDPKLAAVDLCRGKLCSESGQNERARKLLDKYLAGQPDHIDALITRARLLVRLGERKAAANDFSRAVAVRICDGRSYRPKTGTA